MENKISVIVPARNEEKTILNIINLLKNHNDLISEIIIVDNGSDDNTYEIAKNTGVKTIKCNYIGKGYAMEIGIKNAKGDILVFLDADIDNYSDTLLQTLTEPILQNRADFVKSNFERTGGRVTELVAKPLLEQLFPNMYRFSQPLSGMIAGRRKVFENIYLEKDYGVDIGILLDVLKLNARVEEVHIGKIRNDSQPWIKLEKMSREVIKAIIKRANNVKQYAYITLLSTDEYLDGVLVLNESLKRVNAKYPLVVAVTNDLSTETQRKLNEKKIKVIQLEKIDIPKDILEKNSKGIFNHWSNTFDKLSIFELTEFDKLVFLDSDMYVRKNIDDLFDKKGFSAVIDRKEPDIQSEWIKLTSGTIVIEPEKGIINKFKEIMSDIIKKRESIGDQDVLQEYDTQWADKEELHLDVKYNMFFIYLDYYTKISNYDIDEISVIHFILKTKPWNLCYEKIDEYMDFLNSRLKYNYNLTGKEVYNECFKLGDESRKKVLNEYLSLLQEVRES